MELNFASKVILAHYKPINLDVVNIRMMLIHPDAVN